MASKLTDRQQQILDLIRQTVARTGFPPTRAEIAQALGFRSPNAAEDHLKALARKGAIELTAGASRGIRLKDAAGAPAQASLPMPALAQLLLPLVGRVAAGSPILAAEHVEREVGVDPNLFAQAPDYLLKVRGMSMRDAGILEGDLLAVKKHPRPATARSWWPASATTSRSSACSARTAISSSCPKIRTSRPSWSGPTRISRWKASRWG